MKRWIADATTQTYRCTHWGTDSNGLYAVGLWHPLHFPTPSHGSLKAMMGEWRHGILTQNLLCGPHPPLSAWLFCQPSMPCTPLTLWRSWRSRLPPPEWLKGRPLSDFTLISAGPFTCGAHGLRQCPQLAFLFRLVSGFPLSLWLKHTLARPSSFVYVVRCFCTCRQENTVQLMLSHVLWSVLRCVPLQAAGLGWKH